MKNGFFYPLFSIALLCAAFSPLFGADLLGINFEQQGEVSQLEFIFDRDGAEAEMFENKADRQIIVDLKKTQATERVMRAFDTSEFSGSVVYVRAYEKKEDSSSIRVAIQLRENVRSILKKKNNRYLLQIENRFGAFTAAQLRGDLDVEVSTSKESEKKDNRYYVPKSNSLEDILENVTLSGRKKYIGKTISVNVKSLPVGDILEMISQASGFNIILTKEVDSLPALTLNLVNTPWDQALDTVLALNKLIAKKNGEILMVKTIAEETRDQQEAAKVRQFKEKEEPLVTKAFPISFAEIKTLEPIVKPYLTSRGGISFDERTNTLLVKDTVESIERVKKIVELLDGQTPQVLIESKIVEVTESSSKNLGLSNGLSFGYDPFGVPVDLANLDSRSPVGTSPVPGTQEGGPGFTFSSVAGNNGGGFLLGSVGQIGRLFNINFQLNLLETESSARIIASPKVITQNNQKAKISTTQTTNVPIRINNGTETSVTFSERDAKLELEVTPHVTNEGSISLKIDLLKEAFGAVPQDGFPKDLLKKNLSTNVLVDNGSTIVLGGVYQYRKEESHNGVPFLKDIPLLGWLFRTPYNPNVQKEELVIFLTPRIINQEEAGLIEAI